MLQHWSLHCETWGVPLSFGEDIKTLVFSFFLVCVWCFFLYAFVVFFFCFLLLLAVIVE